MTFEQQASSNDLNFLYRETILLHATKPVGFQKPIKKTCSCEQFNPLCGDRVVISVQIKGDLIEDAAFDGESCAICTASASLICEQMPGRKIREADETYQWLKLELQSNRPAQKNKPLQALLGVRKYPSRIRCALLPWEALTSALSSITPD